MSIFSDDFSFDFVSAEGESFGFVLSFLLQEEVRIKIANTVKIPNVFIYVFSQLSESRTI